jgi:hypothetical protein
VVKECFLKEVEPIASSFIKIQLIDCGKRISWPIPKDTVGKTRFKNEVTEDYDEDKSSEDEMVESDLPLIGL